MLQSSPSKTNTPALNFREAVETDLPAMVEILNQAIEDGSANAYTEPFEVRDRLKWFHQFEDAFHHLFVAEENNHVIGYCSLVPYRCGRKALQITSEISYYVHHDHFRKGVGSFLMQNAILHCPKFGIRNLLAILTDVNEPSQKILQKNGFSEWGHFPNVFDNGTVQCGQLIYGINLPVE